MWASVLRVMFTEVNETDLNLWPQETFFPMFWKSMANGHSLLTTIILHYTCTIISPDVSVDTST